MNNRRLWLNSAPDAITIGDLIWREREFGRSSLAANVGPNLVDLGLISEASRDVVWLAVTSFLADRTVKRPNGWQRDMQICVPVADTFTWHRVATEVNALLSFLTSDAWEVTFWPSHNIDSIGSPNAVSANLESSPESICLFSGGADSVCGLVTELAQNRKVLLASHWDWSGHASIQNSLITEISRLFETEIPRVSVKLGRTALQLNGGTFPDEPTRRSRSLLFIAIGLALADAHQSIPLNVFENGFTSLNPALAPERRGALSTRTTHPRFMTQLRNLLQAVGAYGNFVNPFEQLTKGEMFKLVADAIGSTSASKILSKSHSCSHVRMAMNYGRSPSTQCGVCLGCMTRRAAFIASDLHDQTAYLVEDLSGSYRERFFANVAGAAIETVRYAISRDFGFKEILALNLPADSDFEAAVDLVRRGFDELAALELPICSR